MGAQRPALANPPVVDYPAGLDTPAGLHAFADELDARAEAHIREGNRLAALALVARRRASRMAREGIAS